MSEHALQNLIRIELSKLGYTVFRINVGKVRLSDGRWFDTGLPKGFSDLIAIKEGRINFIEVKFGKNKASPEQLNFVQQMQKKGCNAGIAYSVEDAVKICKEARHHMNSHKIQRKFTMKHDNSNGKTQTFYQ